MADTISKIRRKTANDILGQQAALGKLPPQARDLEQAVLGAVLIDGMALSKIDFAKPEIFYEEAHRVIFEAILQLSNDAKPIDMLTVTDKLRTMEKLEIAGGAFYIAELSARVSSSANIEYHCRIIAQKHIQRELIRVSNEIIDDAYQDKTDVFELLDKAEKNLFAVSEGNLRKNYQTMKDILKESLAIMEEMKHKPEGLSGVRSGFTELDRVTSGWQKSDLIILAARPGMGKTALALNLARNAAILGNQPTAVFSLEMSAVQLVNRLISAEADIDSGHLRSGKLTDDELSRLNSKIGILEKAPIYIDDTPGLSVFELRAKLRRLKEQYNIELAVVDYLQLMVATGENGKSFNREQEISTISRSLKGIAKELNIPIIVLSQLSRESEKRADKSPQLSDLRDSGAIEQDADMVIFIYRPNYYKIDQGEGGLDVSNLAEIDIQKHRNGSTAKVQLTFLGQYAKFTDYQGDPTFGAVPAEAYNPMGGMNGFNASNEMQSMTLPSKMNNFPPPSLGSNTSEFTDFDGNVPF